MSDRIEAAKKLLAANGYVVLKQKSYRQAQERQRIAEALRRSAEEYRESGERYVREELGPEIRHLRNRCEFLYGAAIKAGAHPDDLRGRIYLDDHTTGRSRLNPEAQA